MATKVVTRVRVVDKGAKALIAKMRANRFRDLKVGILAPDADVQYTGDQGPTTIGEAAFFNEFGTESIPARSWLRSWVDGTITVLRVEQLKAYQSILLRGKNEKTTLAAMGERYADQITGRIDAKIPPPNADRTIEKKGFDHPLIDSGLFIDRVSSEVTDPK